MSAPKMKPTQKLGLAIQLIGITLLLINIYTSARTETNNVGIIPIALGMVIGGMFLVIERKKK